jgi:hypothetical protein
MSAEPGGSGGLAISTIIVLVVLVLLIAVPLVIAL